MTELQIQCYENIARHIHSVGQQYISEGNPCSDSVSVLFYVQDLLAHQSIHSNVVIALANELHQQNEECIDWLRESGSDVHGY